MLALSLAAQPLLAKADALGISVYEIFLNGLFASSDDPVFAEIILTVSRKKMFTGDLLDSRVEIRSIIEFLDAQLIVLVVLWALHISESKCWLSTATVLMEVLVASIQSHRPNLG
jgi:hypothetical protein